jgi:hypothetical protein
MSIQFHKDRAFAGATAEEERTRCRLIVEGLPLGYRNEDEHEVLENFAHRGIAIIESGMDVTQSID